MNPIFERKKKAKSTSSKAKKSGESLTVPNTALQIVFQKHQSRPHIPMMITLPLYLTKP